MHAQSTDSSNGVGWDVCPEKIKKKLSGLVTEWYPKN